MSGTEYLSVLRKIENELVLVIFDGSEFHRREPASFKGLLFIHWVYISFLEHICRAKYWQTEKQNGKKKSLEHGGGSPYELKT